MKDFSKLFSLIIWGIKSEAAIYKKPPAAKASKNGIMDSIEFNKKKPRIPPNNATIAERKLKRRAFCLEKPAYKRTAKSPSS